MAPNLTALDSGNPDSDDESSKQARLAARAARFTQKLEGNRYKVLEDARARERQAFEAQGLIKVGKTELEDAVDLRGTCEKMCSDYEREFREWTREVHPFERLGSQPGRIDPNKAVTAYSRSDAGAGHGDSAILPSDLRTPATLVRTLDYLIDEVMSLQPPAGPSAPSPRRALGYSAGFIRDRTRAIRKDFAMQSSWGHVEAIATFERIARWHILSLRELQEESGTNTDMHIDSAELGRCFTSLRQHYDDRREETGLEMPCPNEPEFRAYMLIFDLAQKSVSISTAELPRQIINHPLVQLAWEIRKAAQRNFDSQKEGSKLNAEYGSNLISRFVRLLKQPKVPYLLSCLVEIRLREMRRSALRATVRTYAKLRDGQPIRTNEQGEVMERRMMLVKTLDTILGCEEQEEEESAWEDIVATPRDPDSEAVEVVRRFGIDVYEDLQGPVGAMINAGAPFNDNKDAPFTRRWKSITAKRQRASYADVVNGKAGVHIDGLGASTRPAMLPALSAKSTPLFSFKPSSLGTTTPQSTPPKTSAFSFNLNKDPPSFTSLLIPTPMREAASKQSVAPSQSTLPFSFGPPKPASQPAPPPLPMFSFTAPTPSTSSNTSSPAQPLQSTPAKPLEPVQPLNAGKAIPSFFSTPPQAGTATPSLPSAFPPHAFSAKGHPISPLTLTAPVSGPSSPPNVAVASPSRSSPTGRRRPAALSLSRSVLRIGSSSELDRRKTLAAPPVLAQELIAQILTDILIEAKPELSRTIQQEKAARAYKAHKAKRSEVIRTWSDRMMSPMLEALVRPVCWEAVGSERKRREEQIRRKAAEEHEVEEEEEAREVVERDRAELMNRLTRMGLRGRSESVFLDRVVSEGRIDEYDMDLALLQTQRATEHLLAPSTFLHLIAKHIATLLAPVSPLIASFHHSSRLAAGMVFNTVLSLSTSETSMEDGGAQRWLIDKLRAERKGADGEEGYHRDGILFGSEVAEEGRSIGAKTGLVVFEAPEGDESSTVRGAQQRLVSLVNEATGHSNCFDPALLIVTWSAESLGSVKRRLKIGPSVDAFGRAAAMSLDGPEDLDVKLAEVLRVLFPRVSKRSQLVIPLKSSVDCFIACWSRLRDAIEFAVGQAPHDGRLASTCFAAGISAINEATTVGRRAVPDIPIAPASTYSPNRLPAFESVGSKIHDVAESIGDYLKDDAFVDLDDVDLVASSLVQSAWAGQALPVASLLTALTLSILGEIREQSLSLEFWSEGSDVQRISDDYLASTSKVYQRWIEEKIVEVSAAALEREEPVIADEDNSRLDVDFRTHRHVIVPTLPPEQDLLRGKTSLKRTRLDADGDENSPRRQVESKAAKNARLLRALKEASRTLLEIEGENRWESDA